MNWNLVRTTTEQERKELGHEKRRPWKHSEANILKKVVYSQYATTYNNILLFKINVECIQFFLNLLKGTKEGIGTRFWLE